MIRSAACRSATRCGCSSPSWKRPSRAARRVHRSSPPRLRPPCRLGLRRLEGLEGVAVSTVLGLSLLAHAAFALGALGLLTRSALIVLVAGIHLLGLPVWRETRWVWKWKTGLGLVLAAAPLFILALYPPTA